MCKHLLAQKHRHKPWEGREEHLPKEKKGSEGLSGVWVPELGLLNHGAQGELDQANHRALPEGPRPGKAELREASKLDACWSRLVLGGYPCHWKWWGGHIQDSQTWKDSCFRTTSVSEPLISQVFSDCPGPILGIPPRANPDRVIALRSFQSGGRDRQ